MLGLGCSGGDAPGPDGDGGRPARRDAGDAAQPHGGGNLARALVPTTSGWIQGNVRGGVAEFLGIPYADAPVGPLRWKPPRPKPPWDGVRQAVHYGPACPQVESALPVDIPGADYTDDCPEDCRGPYCCKGSEDCLYANIWTPVRGDTSRLPVMVWIHGGGLNTGAGSLSVYNGRNLAKERNVVVVTFNYRLGPLGFLAHPGLTEESPNHASGNYGFQDQIFLLRWVHDNIANFGGDPDNVTIFGESAGGVSVCTLLASPIARGLFHRAIDESGPCNQRRSILFLDGTPEGQTESAHEQGMRVAELLGCSRSSDPVACMRSLKPVDIFRRLRPSSGIFVRGTKFSGIVDGYVLDDAPLSVLQQGRGANVPVIFGATGKEASLWRPVANMPALGGAGYRLRDADATVDPGRFARAVTFLVGREMSALFLSIYPTPTTGSEALITYERFLTDGLFICPLRRSAKALSSTPGSNVWFYVFSRVPPNSIASMEGFGAPHSSEIAYVFKNLDGVLRVFRHTNEDDVTLSGYMTEYWSNMAALGTPNGPGVPMWPSFSESRPWYKVLDIPLDDSDEVYWQRCDAFDQLLASSTCRLQRDRPYACYW